MDISKLEQKLELSESDIQKKVAELGAQITLDYKDKNLMVVPLLKGSFIFAADLIRKIDCMLAIEFITTSSYENSHSSSGTVELKMGLDRDISGFDVLIVDDIVDSGTTLSFVREYIANKKAKSIKTCTLLDKPSRRQVEIKPDYCGYEVEDAFIVGYGLNFGDHYRNIPYIFSVQP